MEKGLKVEGDGDKWRHLKVGRIDEQGKKKKKEMHDCQQDRLGSKEELTHENINNGKGK